VAGWNRLFGAHALAAASPEVRARSETWPHRRRDLSVVAAFAMTLHGVVYLLANHYPLGVVRQLRLSALDLAVPFWPWTVFIYLSDYLLLFLSFQCCRTRASADRFLFAEFFVIAASTLTHWTYPVAFPRALFPLPADLATLPATAMTFLRTFDAETSCLPSLHVAAALLAPLLISRDSPRAFPWLLGWAALVALSTMTTKQHYALDVGAGAMLALLTTLVANAVRPVKGAPPG
jgi:membrane-associated phospholipid phosphatase